MPPRRTPAQAPDHYAALDVPPDATAQQITRAYRTLVRALHPDTGSPASQTTTRFTAVTAAYAILHNPASRVAYDRTRTQPDTDTDTQSPTRPRPEHHTPSPRRTH